MPLLSSGIYHDCQGKHLSHSHYWLLIRECSKSTCTKCIEAEMESEEEKIPFYIKEYSSNSPFSPTLCEVEHLVSM